MAKPDKVSTADRMAATVATIIDSIERGDHGKWTAPWHGAISLNGSPLRPTNIESHNGYRGGNRLVLGLTAMDNGWGQHWGTYRQWSALGAQVRKGERATTIFRPMPLGERAATADTEGRKAMMIWSTASVFNATQVDGWIEPAADEAHKGPEQRIDEAQAAVDALSRSGMNLHHHDKGEAYYSPSRDIVVVPHFELFKDAASYYATTFHETTHWTGHSSRLNRQQRGMVDVEAYGFEELVAELGAAFLCADYGMATEGRPDHAAYLASWIATLKSNPKLLWTASSQAEAAVGFITDRVALALQVSA